MSEKNQSLAAAAQHRVAQKYRLLGYEVDENPEAALLPAFMAGVSPDILARSKSDNVIVEVKERRVLKGSNDLVGIAQRVAEHPGWRFELVVLPTKGDHARSDLVTTNFDKLLEKADIATTAGVQEAFYSFLANIMVAQSQALARRYNVKVAGKTDRNLFLDLSFRGIVPEHITQKCLSVIAKRDELARDFDRPLEPSGSDLRFLVQLCRDLEELT